MSTRAQVRFATREEGVSFNEHPEKINAQFYVHHDGYPTGLGIDITRSLLDSEKLHGWEIEYLDTIHTDLNYIYYVWQSPSKTTWISIFDVGLGEWCSDSKKYIEKDKCIFVGEPQKLIEKYKINTND